MLKQLRKEARVVGIDDGPFVKGSKGSVLVVGVVYRGGQFMDAVLSTKAKIDGTNATERIARMIQKCKYRPQLHAVFLNGVAVGGFNIINLEKLHKMIRLPVIVVVRNYPDFAKIKNALRVMGKPTRFKIIETLPKPTKVGKVYMQYTGTTLERAKELIKLTTTHSFIPEPIRIAHLIARGVVMGESRGRA